MAAVYIQPQYHANLHSPQTTGKSHIFAYLFPENDIVFARFED